MPTAKAKKSRLRTASSGLLVLLLISCDFPRDPDRAWEEVSREALRVGVAAGAPADDVHRAEKRIIEGFARAHGLKLRYVEGTESDLVERLERHELHLVFGGFDKKTLWARRAGISASYDGRHVFLLPKGENRLLYELEGYVFRNGPGS